MNDTSQIVNILESLICGISERLERDVADGISHSRLAKKFAAFDSDDPGETLDPSRSESGLPAGRPASRVEKRCSIEGCQRQARARGMCSKHYQRVRYAEQRLSNADGSNTEGQLRGSGVCSLEGCEDSIYAKQMCSRHFMAWVRSRRKSED
ncbi:MAG TPA: hypothetical protein VM425_17335 [Myxococcota bacterium]|nr:hypothetical protein [Myxococcota bacterium]